ncbi:hypothetical protein KM92DES2_12700 [uncultured Desulfovibrio sp.]|uniref:Uncharacterized protein n=1 Tax=uncultured Desulfovibrio sp. TaxID=167968 RepID=A0A212KCF8_9BACT|nr:hypothetical protein KM92DES2_12700 [uncultured Desulfovibrio sp.]
MKCEQAGFAYRTRAFQVLVF